MQKTPPCDWNKFSVLNRYQLVDRIKKEAETSRSNIIVLTLEYRADTMKLLIPVVEAIFNSYPYKIVKKKQFSEAIVGGKTIRYLLSGRKKIDNTLNRNSNILFLTPGFPENEQDDNCIPIMQLYIKACKKLNPQQQFHVIAFQYPFEKKVYTWHGIHVYAVGGKNRKYGHKTLTWIKAFRYFLKIHRKEKITTIHSFWLTECTLLGLILSRIFRINLVATVLGQDAKKENNYLRFIAPRPSPPIPRHLLTITCPSAFVAGVLKKSTGFDCNHIIPFGLEKGGIPAASSERTNDIIGVGNLGPIKNFSLFIDIIQEVKKKFPGIKALIVGGGEEHNALQLQIDNYNLNENIKLLGEIPRGEVLRNMGHSKLLLHTSEYEGQGYVFMEAFAYGLDVVAFDVGYIPESDKMHRCTSKDEMVKKIEVLLEKSPDFLPRPVMSMEETVKEFQKIYR